MPPTLSPESVLDLAAGTALGKNHVLRVKGESLADEQIHDGDYLIVSTRPARAGDIVVAKSDGKALVRKLLHHDGVLVRLGHLNPTLPISTYVGSIEIQGILVAVIRKY
jgi:repressor LexA